MLKSGIYLSLLFILTLVLFGSSCEGHKAVVTGEESMSPQGRQAYDSFLNSVKENSSVYNPLIYNNFRKAESLLKKDGQLLLYSKMGEYFFKNDAADSALQYFSRGLDMANSAGNSFYISYFHLKSGEALNFLSDYEPALVELKLAYSLSLSLDSVQLQINSARNLGNVYWNKGDFDLALTYYFNSLDISRKAGNMEGVAAALSNIGIIYQEIRDFEKALDYYKQSEKVAETNHFTRLLSSAYNNVGDAYMAEGIYDSALFYFQKSLAHFTIDDTKFSVGIYLGNIAEVYLKTDSLEKARKYFLESLKYASEISDKIGIANCNLGLADVNLHENNLSEAFGYLINGTKISEELGSFKHLDYSYNLNSIYYLQKKDLSTSYKYLEKQLEVRDTFSFRESGENVARLENRYREVQNLREIEILKEKQKDFISLLILGFTAFIIIVIVIYIAYRQKAKSNLLLNEKNLQIETSNRNLEEQRQQLINSQEKLRRINQGKDVFLTIISHDLKNPLSAVRGFTELLVKNYDSLTDDKRKLFLNEVFDSIERITLLINNVLYWVKSQTAEIQMSPASFNLNKRIADNTALYSLMMHKKDISISYNVPDDIIVFTDMNVFDMILRNILSNALKFTPSKGKILITAEHLGQKIKISVADNGVGIPHDKLKIILGRTQQYSTAGTNHEQGTGLGLDLTFRFIDQIGGTFEIISEPGKGTAISFTLDVGG
jgi:signal transduction histidine kinase